MKKILIVLLLVLGFNSAKAQFCPPQPSPIPGLNYACWDHLYFLMDDTVCVDEGTQNVNLGFMLYYGYSYGMAPNWNANIASTWIYKVNGQPYNPTTHANYQWSYPYSLFIGEIPSYNDQQYVELEIALFGTFPPAWAPAAMGGGVMFKKIYVCVNDINEPPYVILSNSLWSP